MNSFNVVGRLGADPEVKVTEGGLEIATLRLADNFKAKVDGEWTKQTNWWTCKVFGKRAEIVSQYTSKGSELVVSGRVELRQWEDKEGNKRITPEVIVNDFQFVGSSKDATGEARTAQSSAPSTASHNVKNMAPTFDTNEEIPF